MRAQDTFFWRNGGPAVMGILNVTPDSFYLRNTKLYESDEKLTVRKREEYVLELAGKMLEEGASIIDVGGYSTRPGAKEVSEQEELERVVPAIGAIRKEFPKAVISVDTFRSNVAVAAAEAGANIINDISGGTFDPHMLKTVGGLGLPYVLMHIKGTAATMHENPQYDDVCEEVMEYFKQNIAKAQSHNIRELILDPGFGFSKNTDHNYELLQGLEQFKTFGYPLLAGFSRKSMINKVLGTTPEEALNGTTVLNTIALLKGADILRVHDVKEAMEVVKLVLLAR